ncbi:MAG: hypothetical protein WD771_05805 [Gemmatimonadaceae bacterium]
MRTARIAALAAIVTTGAAAQSELVLPRDADPNDWEAYFDLGVSHVRSKPALAEAAFMMASSLDPSRAEPIFARYVTFWLRTPMEDYLAYLDGNEAMWRRPHVQMADSLLSLSLRRNPFVHRGLELLMFDRFPGRYRTDPATRAWIEYSAGKFQEAIRIQTPAIDRNPRGTIWLRYDRALSRVADRDLAGALTDLQFILDELRRQEEVARSCATIDRSTPCSI